MIKVYKLKIEDKIYEVELEDITTKDGIIVSNIKENISTEKTKEEVKEEAKQNLTLGEDVLSPMQGLVLNVCVNVGDKVNAGDELIILEAMKMENPIVAPISGTISSVNVSKGENVDDSTVLVTIS